MSQHVQAHPDPSLRLKRAMFSRMYRAARHPVAEWLAGGYMAPDHTGLALAQGESLVRSPRRVLALTAHPDDLEFFAGGTLRRMVLNGSEIHALVLSDGEKRGNWKDLGDRRRREQEKAARIQGYASVKFAGLPDFGLPEDPRLELAVARAWDDLWPDVVLAFDPKELVPEMANRDHKALGRTVMDLTRARLHTGAQVYFYGTHHPTALVDITPVMGDKLRAVKAHKSQMVYLDEAETDGAFRLMGRLAAHGVDCQWAEALYRLI